MALFMIANEISQNITVISSVSMYAIQPADLLHHLLTNWLSLSAANLKMRYWNDTQGTDVQFIPWDASMVLLCNNKSSSFINILVKKIVFIFLSNKTLCKNNKPS